MKKYYKQFLTKEELYKAIGEVTDELDTQAMLDFIGKGSPLRYYLITKEGKMTTCMNFKQFMRLVRSFTKLNILHHSCFNRGRVTHIYTTEDYFNTEISSEELAKKNIFGSHYQAIIPQDEKVPEILAPSFDKAFAESLLDDKNVKKSKDDLETYGISFGIDLKKNKSFANMLIALEAHVAGE